MSLVNNMHCPRMSKEEKISKIHFTISHSSYNVHINIHVSVELAIKSVFQIEPLAESQFHWSKSIRQCFSCYSCMLMKKGPKYSQYALPFSLSGKLFGWLLNACPYRYINICMNYIFHFYFSFVRSIPSKVSMHSL